MSLIKSLKEIKLEIKKHSPNPDKVSLLAVSKKQSIDKINGLFEQGQRQFGENYVQEALEKMNQLPKQIEWHLIGHLQSKKVNSVIGKFYCIHSVDSWKLAQLISDKSSALNCQQNIFLEVNMGNEETKTGFTITEIQNLWSELTGLKALRIFGLMALPPPSVEESVTRNHFRLLKKLLDELRMKTNTTIHPLDQLSMGTSQDYILALEEGSTMIRIGTILFGERV